MLVLLLIAPPALGSFAAGLQADSRATPGSGGLAGRFTPLPEPVGGAVPLPVSEFVSRALYDPGRSLEGERVRLLGFAHPQPDGSYLLVRFSLFCCAADAQAYQLEVRGGRTRRTADQWLVVEGRWQRQPVSDALQDETWPTELA